MIAIDLIKQQALDADPRPIQQVNFTANLDVARSTSCIELFNFYQYKMIQYNNLNVKLSNSRLNELKSTVKNKIGVVLKLLLSMVGDDENNFPHKLLLTNRHVKNLSKPFFSTVRRISL